MRPPYAPGIPFEGNYGQWLAAKQKRMENEAKADRRLQRAIDSELDFLRSTPAVCPSLCPPHMPRTARPPPAIYTTNKTPHFTSRGHYGLKQ